MATITTRAGKGSALTFNEVDDNFTNLNSDGISNASALSSLTTTVSGKVSKAGDTMTGALVNQGVVSHEYANNNATGSLVTLATPTTSLVRLTNASLASVAGIGAGVNGQLLKLINKTGNVLSIANESSSATAVARIQTGTAADITLSDNASLSLVYDSLSGRWNIVGSAAAATSSGGINYITNGLAAADTTGWNTYADAAGSQPVDGAGGTPNVLWTRSTSTPLRGIADFNFEKDAANRQGQGVSVDFTIDQADLAKVLTVSFDYQVFNAAYTTGDLAVYIIADPNGTPQVIQPAGYQIQQIAGSLPGKHIATFQTSSIITSYRLCIHVATTNANTYILALDNVSVGPQVVQYGAPVTDKQAFTMVVTGTTTNPTFGTQVVNTATWRRVGDCMEISWQYRQSTAGTAGSGSYLFALPSGYVIDTSKLNVTGVAPSILLAQTVVGAAGVAGSGNQFTGYVAAYDSTRLYMSVGNDTINPTQFGSSTSQNFSTAAFYLSFTAVVPILGWSSSVQMSNDTDTRVVAARGNRITSTQTIGLSATAGVVFNSFGLDTHSSGSISTGEYIAPVPGQYSISTMIGLSTSGTNHTGFVTIEANGVDYSTPFRLPSAGEYGITHSVVVSLQAGQMVRVKVTNGSGTVSLSVLSAASWSGGSTVTIQRLSGPSAIAASETVAGTYSTIVGTALGAGVVTKVPFATKEYDTHGAFVTDTFTAPVSGLYDLHFKWTAATVTLGTGQAVSAQIFKNNSTAIAISDIWGNGASINPSVSVRYTARLLAGETIDFRARCSTATSIITLAGYNWFNITRVGNY